MVVAAVAGCGGSWFSAVVQPLHDRKAGVVVRMVVLVLNNSKGQACLAAADEVNYGLKIIESPRVCVAFIIWLILRLIASNCVIV
jgi:hypothetical protein